MHPLVKAEWPHIASVPEYDFQIATDDVHLGVYVRRISGRGWYALAGLVNHVVVTPEKRGQGIGSWAVREACRWIAGVRVPFALLHCDPKDEWFYRRLGFNPAPGFAAPSHRGPRMSMVAELAGVPWPGGQTVEADPW